MLERYVARPLELGAAESTRFDPPGRTAGAAESSHQEEPTMIARRAPLLKFGFLIVLSLAVTYAAIEIMRRMQSDSGLPYFVVGLLGVLAIALIYGAATFLLEGRGLSSKLTEELSRKGAFGIALYLMLMIVFFAYLRISAIPGLVPVKMTSIRIIDPPDQPGTAGVADQLEPAPSAAPADSGRSGPLPASPRIIAQAPQSISPWPAGTLGAIAGATAAIVFLSVRKRLLQGRHRASAGIGKTEGVCGGSARIRQTRIPVWLLIELRDTGVSEAQILADYPDLRAEDLVNAWAYARSHAREIEAEIHENEVA